MERNGEVRIDRDCVYRYRYVRLECMYEFFYVGIEEPFFCCFDNVVVPYLWIWIEHRFFEKRMVLMEELN